MNLFKTFFAILFAGLLITACSNKDEPEVMTNTIVDIASADAQFSTLSSALQRTNLINTLEGEGPFTVFAPTNDAFTALGVDLATISDTELSNILLYHVFGGQINAVDIQAGQSYISTASTSGPDGTSLSMLLENTGNAVKINGSINITATDITADNGVIHVIDAVALPLDLVGHAGANSDFTSLVDALGGAPDDLVGTLQEEGPLTVFAPVNSAFAAISDVISTLTSEQLGTVLTYHVVEGNILAGSLTADMNIMTVSGQELKVDLASGTQLEDATGEKSNIVAIDVQATNGVIHVLDRVVIPSLEQ